MWWLEEVRLLLVHKMCAWDFCPVGSVNCVGKIMGFSLNKRTLELEKLWIFSG